MNDLPRQSLQTRILAVFLGVVLIVFVAITAIFNVLVDRYVSSTATGQLSSVVAEFGPQFNQGNTSIPDVSGAAPSRLNTRSAVFSLSQDYVATTLPNASQTEKQTAQQLAVLLKTRNLNLSGVANLRLVSVGGTYYVSCIPGATSGQYLVVYVDVTGVVNFAASVNLLLIVIMIAAVVVAIVATVILTRRMTRPLADLTAFAKRIGAGDFRPCTEEFNDKEFATLADGMNQAARQLDSCDKDQKTFFQNASHELRTPLTSITCYAEGIGLGIMEPTPASQTILSEANRLTEMVEDLLTVSRIDSITKEQSTAVCDLSGILATAADEQRPVAEDRGLTFAVDIGKGDMTVRGNDKTLHRAFSNLISNAVRYAEHEVRLSCQHQAGGVVVAVADDGPGVAAQDLPHIFERFYKGADGNHGIGLSIVKSVVEQHGGTIAVESGATGATFTCTFPSGPKP